MDADVTALLAACFLSFLAVTALTAGDKGNDRYPLANLGLLDALSCGDDDP
jgi:hypothetical protein